MKISGFSCFALVVCAATAFLAGCGGSQPPIGAPGAIPQSRASSSYGYNTLYSFGQRHDGLEPKAGLVDLNGTLYGTTYGGGKYVAGTVFSISATGSEKVLYDFNTYNKHNDGAHPSASLIAVNGVLYGTTEHGGGLADDGTVFKVSAAGKERVLHRFLGYYDRDGANPIASLVAVKGKLYGTTSGGGANQFYGTVFRITTSGKEKVLYSFGYYGNGAAPVASLLDVNDTLYGTTQVGGGYTIYSGGTVFGISAAGAEQKLYTFGYNGPNGSSPSAALLNVGGTLYGTAEGGGSYG
ncbi:MAG: choice-of-anchor tandem repeat GloVer-containing protein, partial [Candidatus Cybelea sp.]